jgi:nitroreductase
VDAGRRAPSGRNVQPREFVLIDDPAVLKTLGASLPALNEASAAIGIVADGASQFGLEDSCAAATTMLLAITALGYASVWIQGGLARVEAAAKEAFGVPADRRLIILLPIGKASLCTSIPAQCPYTVSIVGSFPSAVAGGSRRRNPLLGVLNAGLTPRTVGNNLM